MPITLRNEDIGWFHPDHDAPQDDGMIIGRRCLVFTDVRLFEKHIQAFLDNESTRGVFEKQLVALFPTLLRGPALIWWITETTRRTRQDLCAAGLDALLESLTGLFTHIYDPNNRFNMCKLTLRDFARDERALSVFVQKKLRYARLSALVTDDNTNWDSVMFLILQDMEPVIRQNIRFPKEGREDEDLSEYMAYLDRSRSVILSKALRKQAKKTDQHRPSSMRSRSPARARDNYELSSSSKRTSSPPTPPHSSRIESPELPRGRSSRNRLRRYSSPHRHQRTDSTYEGKYREESTPSHYRRSRKGKRKNRSRRGGHTRARNQKDDSSDNDGQRRDGSTHARDRKR